MRVLSSAQAVRTVSWGSPCPPAPNTCCLSSPPPFTGTQAVRLLRPLPPPEYAHSLELAFMRQQVCSCPLGLAHRAPLDNAAPVGGWVGGCVPPSRLDPPLTPLAHS